MPHDDRLWRTWAQRLYAHLTDSAGVTARALREAGWFDFLHVEPPEVVDVVDYATAALLYLGFSEGKWSGHRGICVGVIAFLEEQTGIEAPAAHLARLGRLLDGRPVEERFVRSVIREIYGLR